MHFFYYSCYAKRNTKPDFSDLIPHCVTCPATKDWHIQFKCECGRLFLGHALLPFYSFKNKTKGTLVPERGWKYQILPKEVHPQTSSPEFSPRIWPQLSSGSRYLLQGLQPVSKPRCLAWAEKRMLQKTCQKFSLPPPPPSPLLLTTRSAELKLSALKKRRTVSFVC